MDEIIIPLANGGSLHCGEGVNHRWGGYLRICDQHGNEILYWDSSEWEEEGELVIGAVLAAANKPLAELIGGKQLNNGTWVIALPPSGKKSVQGSSQQQLRRNVP